MVTILSSRLPTYVTPELGGPRWREARCLSQVAWPHTQRCLPAG